MNPEVSVLVVAHDNENDLPRCLQSIGEHIGVAHETIVVDNASSDNGPDLVRSRHPGVRLLEPGSNLGFAAGNALAARHARGRWLLLLNPDAYLTSPLAPALEVLRRHPEVGALGGRMLDRRGGYRPSAGFFPKPHRLVRIRSLYLRRGPFRNGEFEAEPAFHPVDWVEGSFLLTPRSLWSEVGGLDEGYHLYVEDVDYCRRIATRGFRTAYCPAVTYVHVGGFRIDRMVHTVRGFRRFHALHSSAVERLAANAVLDVGLAARAAVSAGLAVLTGKPYHRDKMSACLRSLFRRPSVQ